MSELVALRTSLKPRAEHQRCAAMTCWCEMCLTVVAMAKMLAAANSPARAERI